MSALLALCIQLSRFSDQHHFAVKVYIVSGKFVGAHSAVFACDIFVLYSNVRQKVDIGFVGDITSVNTRVSSDTIIQ